MTPRPTRRDVLAGVALAGLGAAAGALAGRDRASAPASRQTPSVRATSRPPSATPTTVASSEANNGAAMTVVRAFQAEAQLVATYAAVVASMDRAARIPIDAVLADHRRHLDALAVAAAASVPGWSPPAPSAPPSPLPSDLPALERAASARLIGLLTDAAGDLAGLLASIAASEASHALVVGPLPRASNPSATRAAAP